MKVIQPVAVRAFPLLRRLLPLGLMLCLWGCDDPPQRVRGGGGLSEADEVAQLFDQNVPFEFDFALEDVNGKPLSKMDFAGKVLVVDIWGTWCPPCRMEIPHFVALNRQYGEQGLQVVGLNHEQIQDKEQAAQAVRKFCQSEGIDYPCALLTRRVAQQVPNLEGFPTTLFLDRAGKVRLTAVGYHDFSFLKAAAETLLNEKPRGGEVQPAEPDAKPADRDSP